MKRTNLLRFSLLACMVLAAGDLAAAALTVGSTTGNCGAAVTVPITIDNATGMIALEFRIAYDATKLTVGNVLAGTVTSGFSISSNAAGGVLRVAMASGTAATGSGSVAQIPMTLAAAATHGESIPLTISAVLLNDASITGTNGTVTVSCGGACETPVAPTLSGPSSASHMH